MKTKKVTGKGNYLQAKEIKKVKFRCLKCNKALRFKAKHFCSNCWNSVYNILKQEVEKSK